MDIGMLWYDGDAKRALSEKIARAVAYYRNKYGAQPNVCYVNPTLLEKAQATLTQGVQVRPARTVLPDHFWLGVSEN
jgi:hypothetical protein